MLIMRKKGGVVDVLMARLLLMNIKIYGKTKQINYVIQPQDHLWHCIVKKNRSTEELKPGFHD